MAMPAAITDWTVDMVDALPDDGQRYELIDGALFLMPSPNEAHQDIFGLLFSLLYTYMGSSGIGKVVGSPSDVRKGDRTRNRVQPDVYVVRVTGGKRPKYPYDLHDLLLAVEVVSPSNPLHDYHTKRNLYLRENVGEYWIFNPDARNVSRWRGTDDPGEVLSNELRWHPEGKATEFVLNLPEFFTRAREYSAE